MRTVLWIMTKPGSSMLSSYFDVAVAVPSLSILNCHVPLKSILFCAKAAVVSKNSAKDKNRLFMIAKITVNTLFALRRKIVKG